MGHAPHDRCGARVVCGMGRRVQGSGIMRRGRPGGADALQRLCTRTGVLPQALLCSSPRPPVLVHYAFCISYSAHFVVCNATLYPPPPCPSPPREDGPPPPPGGRSPSDSPPPPLRNRTTTVHAHLQAQILQHKTKEFVIRYVQTAANVRRPTP